MNKNDPVIYHIFVIFFRKPRVRSSNVSQKSQKIVRMKRLTMMKAQVSTTVQIQRYIVDINENSLFYIAILREPRRPRRLKTE